MAGETSNTNVTINVNNGVSGVSIANDINQLNEINKNDDNKYFEDWDEELEHEYESGGNYRRINREMMRYERWELETAPEMNDVMRLYELLNNEVDENIYPVFNLNSSNEKMQIFHDFITGNIKKKSIPLQNQSSHSNQPENNR